MTPEAYGQPYRSNEERVTLGATVTFKTDFLAGARKLQYPEIRRVTAQFRGTVGGVSGGALGRDAAKLITRISQSDSEEVIGASGPGLRVLEQVELGDRQKDPADVSSGNTNTSYVYNLNLLWSNDWRAERARDSALPLVNMLDGAFTMTFAPSVPSGWASAQTDWTVQLFVDVREGRKRELKSRLKISEQVVSLQEDDYVVGGFLKHAILHSHLTTTGYSSWASYTTLNSRTLNLPTNYPVAMLRDRYLMETQSPSATDEILLAAPGAIPVITTRRYAKINECIDTKSLHINLGASPPTNARLLTAVYIDRDPDWAAKALGYENGGMLMSAVDDFGFVKGASGEKYPARDFHVGLARKLPIILEAAGE